MKLNKRSQGETAAGQVINILSNDVQRFDQVAVFLHFIWIMPIQVILVTYLMWNSIGIYCLVGIGAMVIITIPLQSMLLCYTCMPIYNIFFQLISVSSRPRYVYK